MRAAPWSSSGRRPARARSTIRADELRVARAPDEVRPDGHDAQPSDVGAEGEQLGPRLRAGVVAARVLGDRRAARRRRRWTTRRAPRTATTRRRSARPRPRRAAVEQGARALDVDGLELGGDRRPARPSRRGARRRPSRRRRGRRRPRSVIAARVRRATPSTPDGRRWNVRDLVTRVADAARGDGAAEQAARAGDEDLHEGSPSRPRHPSAREDAVGPARQAHCGRSWSCVARRSAGRARPAPRRRGRRRPRGQRAARVGGASADATGRRSRSRRRRRPAACRPGRCRRRRRATPSRRARCAARAPTGREDARRAVVITCGRRPSTQSRPSASRWPTSPVRCQRCLRSPCRYRARVPHDLRPTPAVASSQSRS